MSKCLSLKVEFVRFAAKKKAADTRLMVPPSPFTLTTTTRPGKFVVCFATNATSALGHLTTIPRSFAPQPITSTNTRMLLMSYRLKGPPK